MEEALLEENNGGGRVKNLDIFVEELKKVSYIAVPMVVVTVSQYLLRVSAMTMVGHLNELSLASTAIATSLTNVTGFSLLLGMASALETLCGQAYGAEQYQKLGTYTYSAIICLLTACIPISLLFIYIDKLLMFLGQDPLISIEAGKYSVGLILALFPYAIVQALVRYLQSQSLIFPMVLSSIVALCFNIPICWGLVFGLRLGIGGAALAIGLSHWLNVVILWVYVKYSSACERTRIVFSVDAFVCVWEFLRFAIPSAAMICLEWWSFELIVLLSGLFPNPQLESSVLSICLTIGTIHFFIPFSFGAAASTRVSNELGAGNPEAAKVSVSVVLFLALADLIVSSFTMYCCRYILGYAFSNEKEVVDYVKNMTPLMCVSIVTDTLQSVFSGIARGSGLQHLGAYVNLGAFYLAGIPVGLFMGFVMHLKGKGLWIGVTTGSAVQAALLSLITCLTDWQKQAIKSRERIFEGRIPDKKGLNEDPANFVG